MSAWAAMCREGLKRYVAEVRILIYKPFLMKRQVASIMRKQHFESNRQLPIKISIKRDIITVSKKPSSPKMYRLEPVSDETQA
jgi:hypothetical protein